MENTQQYTFSYEQGTPAAPPAQNQVAPAPQYVQPGMGTQYGMAQQPVTQQQQMVMMNQQQIPQNLVLAGARAGYPYSSPHFYDAKGRARKGVIKWTPEPNEGPYRPFYITSGKRVKHLCVANVDALDDEELEEEMQQAKSKLCLHTFFCCFICALIGVSHIKKAFESRRKGNDVEARNELLDAKIKLYQSMIVGAMIWSLTFGALIIVMIPFMWIPYLIISFA